MDLQRLLHSRRPAELHRPNEESTGEGRIYSVHLISKVRQCSYIIDALLTLQRDCWQVIVFNSVSSVKTVALGVPDCVGAEQVRIFENEERGENIRDM